MTGLRKIRVVLVDDAPQAINMLLFYLKRFENLEVVETFTSALAALEWLLEHQVDLIFADIDMPELTGIDLMKGLINPPRVIYCTSHREFAVESFETHPIDYLMKPIAYDRLQQAVTWAMESILGLKLEQVQVKEPYLFVKEVESMAAVRIDIDDIVYVQAEKNICLFKLLNREVRTRKTLKEIRERLGDENFMMAERSFLINKQLIVRIQDSKIILRGLQHGIPIGPDYAPAIREFVDARLW
ncbi:MULTISPECIES: LytR/AlgR family response regulator transcription factor [Olivibacter]|uniref:LytR/AlgR family response regulator transcription factor n=1 Tax=Olivibacter jilunii TaxID=985016 RepID=A0ABW6B627_9SPHI